MPYNNESSCLSSNTKDPVAFDFGNNKNNQYFKAQHNGFGAAFLVGFLHFQLMNIFKKSDSDKTQLDLLIAFFVYEVCDLQFEKLKLILKLVEIFVKKTTK